MMENIASSKKIIQLDALADDAWSTGDAKHQRYYGVMFGLETARDELAQIVANMMRETADLPPGIMFLCDAIYMPNLQRLDAAYNFIRDCTWQHGYARQCKK